MRTSRLLRAVPVLGLAAAGATLLTPTSSSAAPKPQLAFPEAAAVAYNGTLPSAESLGVCGSDTYRFFEELAQHSPLEYEVAHRLGDVRTTGNAQAVVSGVVASSVVGSGDFPFDHTFGSDFNMDVAPDPAFADLAQLDGVPGGDLHVELGAGLLPHTDLPPGPATGQDWPDHSTVAQGAIQPGYLPTVGDRVIVLGRWIVDCGHTNFSTELHPITFMAWSHTDGDKTIVNFLYNPYYETQRYHPEKTIANDVNNTARFADKWAIDFPKGLIYSILRIQDSGPAPYTSIDHLESWAMIAANTESPLQWEACAPPSATGPYTSIAYEVQARPGAFVGATAYDHTEGCVTMATLLHTQRTPNPPWRECDTPWAWLNTVAAAEGGMSTLDLQAELSTYVAAPFRSRLVPPPLLNCYDPVQGPEVAAIPAGLDVHTNNDLLAPFYGRVVVGRGATVPPPPSTVPVTTTTTTAGSGGPTSTSSTLPTAGPPSTVSGNVAFTD